MTKVSFRTAMHIAIDSTPDAEMSNLLRDAAGLFDTLYGVQTPVPAPAPKKEEEVEDEPTTVRSPIPQQIAAALYAQHVDRSWN